MGEKNCFNGSSWGKGHVNNAMVLAAKEEQLDGVRR